MDEKIIKKHIATYKRNHKGSDLGDVERSKVERDKLRVVKAQKLVQQVIPKDYTSTTDEDMDAYQNALHTEKKAQRTAKTHQERYKKLSQDDDFM